jgi:hypothetical protein
MYSVCVRNVHHEGHEAVTELSLQTIGVSLLAYRNRTREIPFKQAPLWIPNQFQWRPR